MSPETMSTMLICASWTRFKKLQKAKRETVFQKDGNCTETRRVRRSNSDTSLKSSPHGSKQSSKSLTWAFPWTKAAMPLYHGES